MFYREKAYTRINWKNRPNLSTPLGAKNLNKMDATLNELDDRIIEVSSEVERNRLNIVLMSGEIDALEEDVAENTSQINELSNLAEDVNGLKIVNTASGTPAYMDDASNMKIEDITFYGESEQNGTPTPTSPIPIESKVVNRVDVLGKNLLKFSQGSTTSNGITFTVNTDKSVTVNGTATADAVLLLTTSTRGEVDLNSLTGKNIILSGCPSGGSGSTYKFQFWSASKMAVDTGNGATLDLSTVPDSWNFAISIISGTTVNNLTFYPMIRPSFFTDATYEPYQSQTVNLSAPIELNGIGGVRDTDKEKKFGVAVFDGSEDEGWKADATNNTSNDGKYRNRTDFLKNSTKYYGIADTANLLCTHYKAVPSNSAGTWGKHEGMCIDNVGGIMVYDENFNTADISLWKAHLQANPITVVYELAEPIETSLPQADIDAIKNLHTYKPNTVVMNDADAEMDVSYVADSKLYIDKKFEALASAIVNQ